MVLELISKVDSDMNSTKPKKTLHVELQSNGLRLLHQAMLSSLLCLSLWILSPLTRFDVFWSDLLLARQAIKVPDSILLVSITPEDVIANGTERLSRKYLASTLALLSKAGADRVLMDFNMARVSTADEEAAVLAALRLFGPTRIGFANEPNFSFKSGEKLESEASIVNLTLQPDYDGRIRSINGSNKSDSANPCIWLSTGETSTQASAMDLRYDPRTIRRVSLSEIHAGKIPEEQLKNSRVIIANTRELSRTRVTLPLYGPTDRGTILAIGTASSLNGFSSKMPQQLTLMAILSSLLTLASFYVGYATTNINRIFIGFLRLFTIIMVSCYCETSFGGIPTKPASLTLTCLAVISVSVADRLKFFDLLRGLLSGVLSPEEVWVWRTYSDRDTPVVLFDAMGYIKKANPAAILEFQLDPKTWNQNLSELAKQCMPSLGQQNRRLTLQKNVRKVWDVDWPSKHLPIALFNNVTDQHDRLEELESQLVTDPMTGVLNRKGFQLAIESLDSNNTRNYTVFFMDMNGFKAVNDQYGHGAGDILLKVTAQRFRSAISNDDRVARFGGDEFAILIPRRISMEEALSIRDRIESTLIEKIDVGAAKVQVGVAVGFAIPFDEHETRESILERADHDMYQRKMMLKRDERIVKSKLLQEAEIGRMTF